MRRFICLFLLFFWGYMASPGKAENIPDPEKTIRLGFSTIVKKDPGCVFYFLKHLDRWYLQLTPDHKKFVLLNSKELGVGTEIANEEESQGQYLKHLYTVTQFDENGGTFQMVSAVTRVAARRFFRLRNKTILTIKLENNKDGTCLMTSDLELIFVSKSDKGNRGTRYLIPPGNKYSVPLRAH
ncbi:MAG: hypothetical protein HZA29_03025 [Candidatus Omnitrophica bacterium]|nr:hypothetical protein [Candidatus Omnitrophota bacterium]